MVYHDLFESLGKALDGFRDTLSIDLSNFEQAVVDGVQNGQVQKFEISVEVAWKLGKVYLMEEHGVDRNSPKSVLKELFVNNVIDEEMLKQLLDAVDARNQISHIYREEVFMWLLPSLPLHLSILERFRERLRK